MNTLQKVSFIWNNLEKSFSNYDIIKRSDYLRTLLANGDDDQVDELLNRCSACVSTPEDSEMYADLQAKLTLGMKLYESITDDLLDFNTFLRTGEAAIDLKSTMRDFRYSILDEINPFIPNNLHTAFSESCFGMDVFGPNKRHLLKTSEGNVSRVFKNKVDYDIFLSKKTYNDFETRIKNIIAPYIGMFVVFVNKDTYDYKLDKSGKKFLINDGVLYVVYHDILRRVVSV